jgi:hypothetical protein
MKARPPFNGPTKLTNAPASEFLDPDIAPAHLVTVLMPALPPKPDTRLHPTLPPHQQNPCNQGAIHNGHFAADGLRSVRIYYLN